MSQISIATFRYLKQLIFQPCTLRCARPRVDFIRQLATSKTELPKPPKKSPGKFLLFLQDKRDQIVAENPGKKVTELAKIAGTMWKSLAEKEKKMYEEENQKRKQVYAQEYEVYLGSLTRDQKNQLQEEKYHKRLIRKQRRQKIVKRKEEKELNKPKRPGSAYILFLKDWYAKNPSHDSVKGSNVRNFKVIADLWDSLPKEEKMVYNNKAAETMREYKKDLLKWYHKMEAQGRLELVPENYQMKATKSKTGRKMKSGEKEE